MNKVVKGVSAAVLTPRLADESVDVASLRALIEFLMDRGITSFAMNGATGEYCYTTPEQLRLILRTVKEASGGAAKIVCGVGAAGAHGTQQLIRVAEEAGVQALLLPMPYFFIYQQQDVEAFSRTMAASTELPILLYNLPQFAGELQPVTARRLITEVPNIIGIKDSSGSLDILTDLTQHRIDAVRIIGNDSVYVPALRDKICDGVISGVACVLPELMLGIESLRERADSAGMAEYTRLLDEFIEKLLLFPTPWGLKFMAQARGIFTPQIGLPLSGHRRESSDHAIEWLRAWLPNALQIIQTAKTT